MLRKNEAQVFSKDRCYQGQILGKWLLLKKMYENQVLVWNERQVLREGAGACQSQVLNNMRVRCRKKSGAGKDMRVRCKKKSGDETN